MRQLQKTSMGMPSIMVANGKSNRGLNCEMTIRAEREEIRIYVEQQIGQGRTSSSSLVCRRSFALGGASLNGSKSLMLHAISVRVEN